MVSLNESMASRMYQWARDLGIGEYQGSWKAQPHPVKEKFRGLANRLHNYLGAAGYPEGDFVVVPEGTYKVRPYVRSYTDASQGQVGTAGGQAELEPGSGPAGPDHGKPELLSGTQELQQAGPNAEAPGTRG